MSQDMSQEIKQAEAGTEISEWPIPIEHHERIRELVAAKSIARIRVACNTAQYNKAVEANEPEKAYALTLKEKELEKASEDSHNRMWEGLYEAIPALDREGGRYTFKHEEMKVVVSAHAHLGVLKAQLGL